MPARILRDTIKTSAKIAKLSWFEEVLFYRLIVSADDYGNFDARLGILKGMLFPLDDVDLTALSAGVDRLVELELVERYDADGGDFLHLRGWDEHQTTKRATPKYPVPEGYVPPENVLGKMYESSGAIRIRNSKFGIRNSDDSAEPTGLSATAQHAGEALIFLPLNDNTAYSIFQDDVDGFKTLYPAVDVIQSLRAMKGWLEANPQRKKTRRGIRRFINSWLSREQDRGRVVTGNAKLASVQRRYDDEF